MSASSRAKWTFPRRRLLLLAGLLLVLGGAGLAYWHWRHSPPPDPRLTANTPYLNIRPEVSYAGDDACARCHAEQVRTYRQHPMGRSLAPVQPEREKQAHAGRFEAFGVEYVSEFRGDQLLHREVKRGEGAQPPIEFETAVRYVVGSGTRARSFIVEQDGALTESPISWFRESNLWGLSPGFGELHPHFQRPVNAECLFCHSNRAEPIPHSMNRFREPIFHGHAIGCERCHGPGELHVREQDGNFTAPTGKRTIVNPADLAPLLRDSICEQCHLHGQRVVRRGRGTFDFRPGLPLHLFWSVFMAGDSEAASFTGHVEQMHASACYQKSDGRLSCAGCHDPHAVPAAEERIAYFRKRCQACHAEKPCSLPEQERRRQEKDDSCIGCHMPRVRSTDIDHTSITDHRVPRKPAVRKPASAVSPISLVLFHRDHVRPDDPDAARDLGVAMARRDVSRTERDVGVKAQPLLEKALREWPDDVPAWDALGHAHWMQNHVSESLAAFEKALALAPDRELTLLDAGTLALASGDHDKAVRYLQRAATLNPGQANYHAALAKAHLDAKHPEQAVESSRRAVKLNPFDLTPRQFLVIALLQRRQRDEAQAELDAMVQLRPQDASALSRWFASQARAAGIR